MPNFILIICIRIVAIMLLVDVVVISGCTTNGSAIDAGNKIHFQYSIHDASKQIISIYAKGYFIVNGTAEYKIVKSKMEPVFNIPNVKLILLTESGWIPAKNLPNDLENRSWRSSADSGTLQGNLGYYRIYADMYFEAPSDDWSAGVLVLFDWNGSEVESFAFARPGIP